MRTIAFAVACVLLIGGNTLAGERSFTVRDSIEMARFDLENPSVEFSRDKRYFAIVTSRGIMRSNTIESTIWLFDTNAVRKYVEGSTSTAPPPKIAVRWEAVPRVDSQDKVISALQWSADSKTIFFLVENSRAKRQLYKVNVANGARQKLTPPDRDVTQFIPTRDTLVYEATPPDARVSVGTPINADAVDVTGIDLDQILFAKVDSAFYAYNDLWVLRDGKNVKITSPDPVQPLRLLNRYPHVLSISPDGRSAIVTLAVSTIPDSWRWYDPNPIAPNMRIDPNDPKLTSSSIYYALMEYALVNLKSGKVTPLVNAPDGEALGSWAGNDTAVWANDGKRVLLLNTYLPLEGVTASERLQRLHPCAAAVVDVESLAVSCMMFDESYSKKTTVLNGSFTDNGVVLDIGTGITAIPPFIHKGNQEYRYQNGSWALVTSNGETAPIKASEPLSVLVKQNLNTPPALWAMDSATRKTRRLWDPNPQLGAMKLGKASVFRWKDASGHAWIGDLVKPQDCRPGRRYPLVIQTHGFISQDTFLTTGASTSAFAARPLASVGIVVLQLDTDREHESTLKEVPDQIRGYTSAINRLASDGLIDPKRVGIIGWSRTAYHVVSTLIDEPNLFTAAAIAEGVDFSYMQYLLFGTALAGEYNHMYGTMPFGNGLSTWVREAPGFHLNRIAIPLRIEAYQPSSILNEWEIYASLRMQKKPVDFAYIADGQHTLEKPLDQMASEQSNVDWFRFWLQNYEDTTPANTAQYKRWDALRQLMQ